MNTPRSWANADTEARARTCHAPRTAPPVLHRGMHGASDVAQGPVLPPTTREALLEALDAAYLAPQLSALMRSAGADGA